MNIEIYTCNYDEVFKNSNIVIITSLSTNDYKNYSKDILRYITLCDNIKTSFIHNSDNELFFILSGRVEHLTDGIKACELNGFIVSLRNILMQYLPSRFFDDVDTESNDRIANDYYVQFKYRDSFPYSDNIAVLFADNIKNAIYIKNKVKDIDFRTIFKHMNFILYSKIGLFDTICLSYLDAIKLFMKNEKTKELAILEMDEYFEELKETVKQYMKINIFRDGVPKDILDIKYNKEPEINESDFFDYDVKREEMLEDMSKVLEESMNEENN